MSPLRCPAAHHSAPIARGDIAAVACRRPRPALCPAGAGTTCAPEPRQRSALWHQPFSFTINRAAATPGHATAVRNPAGLHTATPEPVLYPLVRLQDSNSPNHHQDEKGGFLSADQQTITCCNYPQCRVLALVPNGPVMGKSRDRLAGRIRRCWPRAGPEWAYACTLVVFIP